MSDIRVNLLSIIKLGKKGLTVNLLFYKVIILLYKSSKIIRFSNIISNIYIL